MREEIIQQGAEAVLIKRGGEVVKRRVVKGYRLKEMDEKIRKGRTRREAKLIEKAGSVIDVPKVLKVDEGEKEIHMDFIQGVKLSESLDSIENWGEVCEAIGENIAKIHDKDIIHGDLTTSNMIYNSGEGKVFFIDFGLGYSSSREEDKAVDLHLIKQALEAKHFSKFERYFSAILKGYKTSKNSASVLKRLEKVEKRGRYKEQY